MNIATDDLILKVDLEKILADAMRIADGLESVWRYLDDNSWRRTLASDRAALNRISSAARDASLAMRQPH